MANQEIVFTDYQADVFNEAEMLLKTQGYLGEPLFEDTYVLNKRLAEWIMANTNMSGTTVESSATNAYNGVLGIETDIPDAPPVTVTPTRSEPLPSPMPVQTVRPLPVRPIMTSSAVRASTKPMIRPAIATPVAIPSPRTSPAAMVEAVRATTPRGNLFSRLGGRRNAQNFLTRFRS
tara:strand:+ start:184 stop:714 length:531 start_codon:yes stop_codon:yes gene_type:complete